MRRPERIEDVHAHAALGEDVHDEDDEQQEDPRGTYSKGVLYLLLLFFIFRIYIYLHVSHYTLCVSRIG